MKSLKAIRVGQNLTQQEVARKAGLSQPAYSNIENGERMPSVETAKRIGAVLGIDWTRFFDNSEQTDRDTAS